jgi:hypothetical protein
MGALTFAKDGKVETVPAGFEDRLIWLCRFGKPRLSMVGQGWFASIEMNTNTTGSSFKVESDFKGATPSAAVDQLTERMLTTLATLTGAAP